MRHALACAVALSAVGGLVVGVPAPARAVPDGDPCVEINESDRTDTTPPTVPSAPLEQLLVSQAQEIVRRRTGTTPGSGVRVAVLDSGVAHPQVPVYARSQDSAPVFYHGTAMAGIIAGAPQGDGVGLVGIAPGAEIYDQRVYDSGTSEDGQTPTDASIVAGLRAITPLAGTRPGDIRIVNVSLTVEESTPELEAAVRGVTDAGAIVVASTGNRVPEIEQSGGSGQSDQTGQTGGDEPDAAYQYGEDVVLFPAGYTTSNSRVVAVGTTTDPDAESLEAPSGLLSSVIDVVVPTYGAVSYSIAGSTCSFDASSTSVAAAEVSGILALLVAAFPRDTPEQLLARLETTATGSAPAAAGRIDTARGRGVVQPVEALTRPLDPTRAGALGPGPRPAPRTQPVALPEPEPDVLRGTRRDAVWWGLFGGGALVVALLLRPVLTRRRP